MKIRSCFQNLLLFNAYVWKTFWWIKNRSFHFQYICFDIVFFYVILKEDVSPQSLALKIKFTSWKWTTSSCFDSQFHFHLSFDLIIDFRVGCYLLFFTSPWFWYTVKKASPWVVVRHANSMVPHDKFSIPDGDGPMCCHSKARFQLQKRNIVTTKVRVRFCVENDFWWDAFLHTARIWCDGQEAAAAAFLFILIRALFSLYCSWAPLLFSVMLTPLVNVF